MMRKRSHPNLKMAGLWAMVLLLVPASVWAGETYPRVLTDMAGRRVVLETPVETMVTTFKPSSLCVFSLGLAEKLVGVDTSFKRDRLARRIFPSVTGIPGVGNKTKGINFETVAGLKPDLVILYSQKDGLPLAERLAAMNIPSIIILPESFETIKQAMRLIASAAGVSERMAVIEIRMDQLLSKVTERLCDLPPEGKKSAYFASSRGLYTTTTGNMLQHEIITRAGVKNVSAGLTGYFRNISPEQLVRWNPDIMILSQHIAQSEIKRVSGAVLRPVNAVAAGNVFRCPSSLAPWDFPSPLSVLATLWIAQKAYPERFADINIQTEADTFHKTLFGMTMTRMGGSVSDTLDW